MNEIIERILRYCVYFNFQEGYRAVFTLDKTVLNILLVQDGEIKLEKTIDKLDLKSAEFGIKQLEKVCEELHAFKTLVEK
jgi:hypothetical protein